MQKKVKLLRQINFRQYKESLNQNEKYLLNTKLKKMDSDKYNISLMLNRVREIKYYNYLNEQKKEINKTSLENTKNHIDFLSDKEPSDIICLGSRTGAMAKTLNKLEKRFPEKFNKTTIYASISDSDRVS